MSARAMHELLNTSRARLLQETDKNIGRFRELQANKTQRYAMLLIFVEGVHATISNGTQYCDCLQIVEVSSTNVNCSF